MSGHAYKLLTPRCQSAIDFGDFAEVVDMVHAIYGRLPIRTYKATLAGKTARVTYRYDAHALDQIREPWVRRPVGWRNNDC